MIEFIIVDDEPIAHRIIEGFAKDVPHLKLKGNCYNAMQAMEFVNNNKVGLIFLDINMPKLKGIDFLKLLKDPPTVIITSAYEQYALEGYELNVTDYLLKPFSFERFLKAVYKINEQSTNINQKEARSFIGETIFLKGDKRHHQVKLTDIYWIESMGSYCKIITSNQTIIVHEKISNFEEKLSSQMFIRIHKSFIVGIEHIISFDGNQILIEDKNLPIGQTFKNNVKRLLK